MPNARIVDFNSLPQTVREQLVGLFKDTGSPQVILSDKSSPGYAAIGWGFLALCSAYAGYAILGHGFGERLKDSVWTVLYGLPFAVCLLAVLFCVRSLMRSGLPFAPGRYLLPLDFIIATDRKMTVIPMSSLINFEGVHQHVNGNYTHTALAFTFDGHSTQRITVNDKYWAERAMTMLRESQKEVRDALDAGDVEALRRLDPFLDIRVTDGWDRLDETSSVEVSAPAARALPFFLRPTAILAIAIAAIPVVGVPVWGVWNKLSDDAMFSKAETFGNIYDYEAYLGNGGKRHADEVRNTRIPTIALEKAKQVGTIRALREFLEKYRGSTVDDDARAAIHAAYEETRAKFHEQAATTDARLLPFMDRLIDYLEKNEASELQVRFRSPSTESLETVDLLVKLLAGKTGGRGTIVPMAPHFGASVSESREDTIVRHLKEGFSRIFPAEILTLSKGSRILETDSPSMGGKGGGGTDPKKYSIDPTNITVPTLDIRYRVSWTGDMYSGSKGARRFVGILVQFQVAMIIPGDRDVFDFELEVNPPDSFTVEYQNYVSRFGKSEDGGPSEGRVYDVMAYRAFDQLSSKLQAVFFRP